MHSEKQRFSKQGGYVMVLFALSLAVFLTLAAMAIDLSLLYIGRLRVERAAKAAAFSTIQYRLQRGWGYFFDDTGNFKADPQTEMTNVLQGALLANLQTSYPSADKTQFTAPLNYNAATDTLNVTVTYQVETYFIGNLLSLINNTPQPNLYPVAYTNTTSLDPAAVALLLDVSGSMNCPNSDCSCRVPGAAGGACRSDDPDNPLTIDVLIPALDNFKTFFNPYNDFITVIPFNLAAKKSLVAVSPDSLLMQPFGDTPARLAEFNRQTSDTILIPKSNTNICDALIQAIDEFNKIEIYEAPRPVRTRKFTILFTDGAPNAFHGVFEPAVTKNNSNTPVPTPSDWYQYGLEWRGLDGVLYRGPGPLVQPAATDPLFDFTISSSAIAPPNAHQCGPTVSDKNSFQYVLNKHASGGTRPTEPGCLGGDAATPVDTIRFSLPGTDDKAGVSKVKIDKDGTDNERALNYARLPYYCAIEAADWLRFNFNSPVFTIGVGPSGEECDDPFENVDNPLVRKDNFMHRLAADPDVFVDPKAAALAFDGKYNFESAAAQSSNCNCGGTKYASYPCDAAIKTASSYTPISNAAIAPAQMGEYYGTADGNQLTALFANVAKSILLRLGN